ncbi:uncharacterized protein UV8b_00675 [Ustilaginoidea virens]|uniref:BZIP domain-containing protein n=1 Tax=Ustilaginoidea virens TaxID=1159556 RepID=A0A8E5HJA4_USTVR|nr:uncharacterized protein UV8b_00675 [Ustilaginoidea virens]QUC16434.1 hypothetical protein UV8b_00675 [Ustilaginoidea virens]
MAAASPVLPYPINFLPDSINSPGYLHPRISHPNMMPNLGGQPSVAHTFDSSNNCPKSTLPVSSPFVASKPPGSGKRCREPVDQKDQAYDSPFPEEDGRKKRSRGRPRLDTKDETAADRRRTQIRLAQRAYRHRKDTAITTLEQRVKELEQANDDMSKEFNDFYALLISERILDAAPHALPRLSTLANKILIAAEKAQASRGDGSSSEDCDENMESGVYGNQNQMLHHTQPSAPPASTRDYHHPEPMRQAAIPPPAYAAAAVTTGTATSTVPGAVCDPLIHVPSSLHYEVVTAATPQNASFPFYSPMDPTAAEEFESRITPGPSPYDTIAVPSSYSDTELTFGRRLQRQSLEGGLRLITMPSPPPEKFASVFGFCLFFESKENIIRRLQLSLSRSQHEDLSNWSSPFTNLGGAGTFFQDHASTNGRLSGNTGALPLGNQGIVSYGKPQEMTGMSMGPWGPEVQATRDSRIDYGADGRMQMMLAGFEGDFFDPDEVETYLRQIGIYIPQRAEFVEAEVDLQDLGMDEAMPKSKIFDLNGQQSTFGSADSGYGGSSHSAVWTTNSNGSVSGAMDSSCSSNHHTMMASHMTSGREGSGFGSASSGGERDHGMMLMIPGGQNHMWPQSRSPTWPAKISISLNVNWLISELAKSSVCLGRTPGVRRKDIGNALKIAAGLVPSPA